MRAGAFFAQGNLTIGYLIDLVTISYIPIFVVLTADMKLK